MATMRKTVATLIVLVWVAGAFGETAQAGCRWPEVLDGALNRSSHLHTGRTLGTDRAQAELIRKHTALGLCLVGDRFLQYYASASLIMGRHGRQFCRWPVGGPGSGNRQEFFSEALRLGKSGVDRSFSDKLAELARCLNADRFADLYADLSLLQAEYAADRR